jgi:UDP-N-acetylmuramoyl-L-alanyl-D-glutamate--2,6-diaminopimelate ligase
VTSATQLASIPVPPPPRLRPERVAPTRLAALAAAVGATAPDDVEVTGVTHDSRRIEPGDLYAALPGSRAHGAAFALEAVSRGARAVLTDPAGARLGTAAEVPVLVVADPRAVLGTVARLVYGAPADFLLLLGVTGTNGKTTTAYFLEAGLAAAGHRTGLVGTIETRVAGVAVPSVRTTPEATDLHALFAVMRERGVTAVAMEVSSHALALGRVDGTHFDVAAFTNLSPDHLDFHGDMASYYAAKASLFTPARSARGVVNVDDRHGARLAHEASVPVQTVSPSGAAADWRLGGGRLRGPAADVPLAVRLPGTFNEANAAVAVATLAAAGVDPVHASAAVAATTVPGRMEPVEAGQPFRVVVDYAHTPDAVATVLAALRPTTPGRLVVVLGCGGDRDPHKRPAMGEAAARGADVVVVTDDNPRSEDPAAIRAAVLAGAGRGAAAVVEIGDRRAAIAEALRRAGPADTVLVAGKGHETGQEAGGVLTPFDDRVVVAETLAAVRA